jgi:hypothetical protein
MTDLFPGLPLGQCLESDLIECEVVTAAVAVGQFVDPTNVAGALPKVSPSTQGSVIAIGIVEAFVGSGAGAVGSRVLVRIMGTRIMKVTSGGSTVGKTQVIDSSASLPVVKDGTTAGSVVGYALQTMASGDTGLIVC